MSDNTLSLNRARTISPRPAVIYARHYGRRAHERREPNGAFTCTRQWFANETIRPMHHRDSLHLFLSLSISLCVSISARDPCVSVFSRYSAPRYFSTSHRVSSMCLCPLMANLSSLTAYNFRSVIIKDVIQTRCMIKKNVALLMCIWMNY